MPVNDSASRAAMADLRTEDKPGPVVVRQMTDEEQQRYSNLSPAPPHSRFAPKTGPKKPLVPREHTGQFQDDITARQMTITEIAEKWQVEPDQIRRWCNNHGRLRWPPAKREQIESEKAEQPKPDPHRPEALDLGELKRQLAARIDALTAALQQARRDVDAVDHAIAAARRIGALKEANGAGR